MYSESWNQIKREGKWKLHAAPATLTRALTIDSDFSIMCPLVAKVPLLVAPTYGLRLPNPTSVPVSPTSRLVLLEILQ